MSEIHTHSFEVGGKTFNLESGRVAKQAGGAVLLGMDETVVLGTATMSKSARDGIDFLPLVCDFEERKYAIGKIPGGYVKRGGRPSERAVLTSRLIDRPIRPLFPKGMRNDIQVITMAFSVDKDVPPDVLAINAAGAALTISDVPFDGPVAGVRVGYIDDEFVLFPSNEDLKKSELDLVVAGHKGAISMVEAGATEVEEDLMIEALGIAHEAIVAICKEFEKFAKKAGKDKREPIVADSDDKLVTSIARTEGKKIASALFNPDKAAREAALDVVSAELIEKYVAKQKDPEGDGVKKLVANAVDSAIKKTIRKEVITNGKRPDGRKLDEIRDLEATSGLLPRVHGSGMFTRGQTQVMTICTLGMPKDAQIMDTLDESISEKRYMHFYNFPPYSVGETRMLRGPGRREVGHGALAERALLPVVPLDDEKFPYTLQLISEVLESNGSTSMASVCGSTLAMLDAGVPLKASVAGIAMGLMSDGKKFRVLTDIQGVEDFTGDMDFKVAGTRDGITALQLDTKLDGIPEKVLADALEQARDARMQILDVMDDAISEPNTDVRGPQITVLEVATDKIGGIIGPGGANIRKIEEESGANVDIQQEDGKGRVLIAADNGESAQTAIDMIKAVTADIEVGMEFKGEVTRLMGRGVLVRLPGGRQGMVPTDELTGEDLRRPDDVVSEGDEITVKVIEVDSQGRLNLTAAGLNPDHEGLKDGKSTEGRPRRSSGGGGGGRGRGRGRDDDRGGRGGRDRGRGRPRRDRDDDDDDRPRRRSRSRHEDDEDDRPRRRSRRDEEDEDRPRRSSRSRSDDDADEERPPRRRRSRFEEDDDEDEKPRRRSRSRSEEPEIPSKYPDSDDDEDVSSRFRPRR